MKKFTETPKKVTGVLPVSPVSFLPCAPFYRVPTLTSQINLRIPLTLTLVQHWLLW